MYFIQTKCPRFDLVKCLAQQVRDYLKVPENSIMQLLGEVALIQENHSLPECIYQTSKNDLAVILHSEESALNQLAHIKLRHYIGWNLYSDEMKAIFMEEALIFCQMVKGLYVEPAIYKVELSQCS